MSQQAKTETTTNAVPRRKGTMHYEIDSETQNRVYDLHYSAELKRWICNCPDTRHRNNMNCKHRRRLVSFIKEQMQERNAIQAQATAIVEAQPVAPEPAAEIIIKNPLAEIVAQLQAQVASQAEIIRSLKDQIYQDSEEEYNLQQTIKDLEYVISDQKIKLLAAHQHDTTAIAIQQLTQVVKEGMIEMAKAAANKPVAEPRLTRKQREDKEAWEEYERDPEAYRAKQKAARAEADDQAAANARQEAERIEAEQQAAKKAANEDARQETERQAQEAAKADAKKRNRAPLNNRNTGFQLMR